MNGGQLSSGSPPSPVPLLLPLVLPLPELLPLPLVLPLPEVLPLPLVEPLPLVLPLLLPDELPLLVLPLPLLPLLPPLLPLLPLDPASPPPLLLLAHAVSPVTSTRPRPAARAVRATGFIATSKRRPP
jgi:hypothetical protein